MEIYKNKKRLSFICLLPKLGKQHEKLEKKVCDSSELRFHDHNEYEKFIEKNLFSLEELGFYAEKKSIFRKCNFEAAGNTKNSR